MVNLQIYLRFCNVEVRSVTGLMFADEADVLTTVTLLDDWMFARLRLCEDEDYMRANALFVCCLCAIYANCSLV